MAIEGFGESLLSKQRERQKKQERKELRTAALGLAGTVGIGLYRKNLKKKQDEFLNSQGVRDLRIQYNQSKKVSDDAFRVQDAITASGGDASKYYYKQAFDELKQEYQIKYGQDAEHSVYVNTGKYDHLIAKDARKIAKERAEEQAKRVAFGEKFRASGTFEDALKMSSKRPNSVAGGILNLIRRKSSADLDKDSIEAFKNTQLGAIALPADGEQRSEAQAVEDAYRKTGDFAQAAALRDFGPLKRDLTTKITVETKFNSNTGKYTFIQNAVDFDLRTKNQVGAPRTNEIEVDIDSTESMNAAALKNARASINPLSYGKALFNDEGDKEFIRRLQNDKLTDGMNLDTIKKHERALQIIQEMAAESGENAGVHFIGGSEGLTKAQESLLQSDFVSRELALIFQDRDSAVAMAPGKDREDAIKNYRKRYFDLMERISSFREQGI
jgi:hypothetical protein